MDFPQWQRAPACTCCPSACHRLAALKLWTALFRERFDTFLVVLTVEAVSNHFFQHGEVALLWWTEQLPYIRFGRAQGQRGILGHRQCVVTREGFEFSFGDNLIDEPHT